MVAPTRVQIEPAPTGQGKPELVAWLDRLQANVSNELNRQANLQDEIVKVLGVNGIQSTWSWSDLVAGDPLSGRMRGNEVQLPNNTELAFSHEDGFGRNIAEIFISSPILPSDLIVITSLESNQTATYSVTGPRVDTPGAPGFSIYPVVFLDGTAGNPQADDQIEAKWKWQPEETELFI